MDSMEVNKAVAAVLIAGIAFFVSGTVGTLLVHQHIPSTPVLKIDMPETAAAPGGAQPPKQPPIAELLASADATAGAAYAKKVCSQCHTFDDGGKTGVGPNLYNVVGRPVAQSPGFNYSTPLKGKGGNWTFEALDNWLLKPATYAQGTRMAFAGITNPKDRANVIDYLRTLSSKPEPRPEVTAAAPTPAGSGAPAGAGDPPLAALLAKADPARGQAATMKYACIACHTFTDGGRAGVGPNLYNVVGAPHGHAQGFAYSAGLKAKAGPWTFEELDAWLKKPSAYAPGTKMLLAGVPDAQDRADIIAYLRTLSANPLPLPTP